MTRFDRYILAQLLILFGFFSLVLVAIFWVSRAVPLFDRLIADGQNLTVFLEFSALSLPQLIATILPLSTFAASVYITNRMSNESELVILKSTGASPWRLARPFLVFGILCALMMSALTHFLVPAAYARLDLRESEISQHVTARLLNEGTFLNPTKDVTLYTRLIAEDGVLRDVFFFDQRNPEVHYTYTAAKAYLVHDDTQSALIMVDGLVQKLETNEQRLSTAQFTDFSFDISALMQKSDSHAVSLNHLTSAQLFGDWPQIKRLTGQSYGRIAEEFHSRFSRPLFCILAALIGFVILQMGRFSRFGVWREIVIAFVLLIIIDAARTNFAKPVLQDHTLWPLIYGPIAIGAVLAVLLLSHSAHPNWFRKRQRI